MIRFDKQVGLGCSGGKRKADEMRSTSFLETVHPDHRKLIREKHQRRLSGEIFEDEYDYKSITKDKKPKWNSIKPVRIMWDNKPAVLAFHSDITKHKETEEALRASEELYRTTVNAMNEGLVISDENLRPFFVNPKFLEITGLTEDDLQEADIANYLAEESLVKLVREFTEKALAGVPSIIEVKGVRKSRLDVVWNSDEIYLLIYKEEIMYLMTKTTCPPDKMNEFATKYLEVIKKHPPDGNIATPIFPGGMYSDDDGICTIVISKVKEGKMEVALKRVYNVLSEYSDIDGFRFEVKTLLNPEEALASIGMGS